MDACSSRYLSSIVPFLLDILIHTLGILVHLPRSLVEAAHGFLAASTLVCVVVLVSLVMLPWWWCLHGVFPFVEGHTPVYPLEQQFPQRPLSAPAAPDTN